MTAAAKRVPVKLYLDPKLRVAVKRAANKAGKSVSDLANEALRRALVEDSEHRRMIRERRKEPSRPYEEFAAELVRDGLL